MKDTSLTLCTEDSSSQNWVSVTGEVAQSSNEDSRIKELYSPMMSAWFGDLKDGTHTGGPEDPRMALIELRPKHIAYWKTTVGKLGFLKEVGQAAMTGSVAENGVNRRFDESVIDGMRKSAK